MLGLCFIGAGLMTWMFSRAIEWRIQRLKVFAEHVLDAGNLDEPLPEEGEKLRFSINRCGAWRRGFANSWSG